MKVVISGGNDRERQREVREAAHVAQQLLRVAYAVKIVGVGVIVAPVGGSGLGRCHVVEVTLSPPYGAVVVPKMRPAICCTARPMSWQML